jgi:hypothetical protein
VAALRLEARMVASTVAPGMGEINEYTKYYDRREFKGEPWIGGEEGEDIWQQWILECKPSAPAKF